MALHSVRSGTNGPQRPPDSLEACHEVSPPPGRHASWTSVVMPDAKAWVGSHTGAPPPLSPVHVLAPTSAMCRGSVRPSLEASLGRGVEFLQRYRGADGLYRTPYYCNAIHPAASIVALTVLEVPGVLDEHRRMIEHLLTTQAADGSFSLYPMGPPNKGVTSLARLAFSLALRAEGGALATDRAFAIRVRAAIEAAERFEETGETDENPVYATISGLLWDVVEPTAGDRFPNIPGAEVLAWAGLEGGMERILPEPFCVMMSAFSVMANDQASKQTSSWLRDFFALVETEGMKRKKAAVTANHEERILAGQDPDGAWLLSPMGTALNLVALKALGYDKDDPPVKAGIEFIRSQRFPKKDGTLAESFLTAALWDTAAIVGVMQHISGDGATAAQLPSIRGILAAQREDSRWSFDTDGSLTDNDDTAVAVWTLCRALPSLPPDLRAEAEGAVRRAVGALLSQQQRDQGWGAFVSRSLWSTGNRGPTSLFSLLNDSSSPDVTGRVVAALLMAERAGILDPEQEAAIDSTVARALEYFTMARGDAGGWWNRWIAGHLPSGMFVLPVLCYLRDRVPEEFLADGRSFFLSRQNHDGGWGESVEADLDPSFVGRGPSTPVQTAFGVVALLATGRARDPEARAAIDRGIAYLLAHQESDGAWANHRNLYTLAPGVEYGDNTPITTVAVLIALSMYRTFKTTGTMFGSTTPEVAGTSDRRSR